MKLSTLRRSALVLALATVLSLMPLTAMRAAGQATTGTLSVRYS
jgi:hypothetical protein